jgi:hypothetical protein
MALIMTLLALAGCEGHPVAAASEPSDDALPSAGAFLGKVWVSVSRTNDPGSIIIFLRDGSLLLDSCSKPFEVTRWGIANGHIRWLEDVVPIEVKVADVGASTMKLEEVGTNRPRYYVTASLPYTCSSGRV